MRIQWFRDRTAAGRALGEELRRLGYADRSDVLVLGLPRGGVPVAYEVATALHAPLDVFVVRKLGVPGQEELAMGAIASGGVRVLNRNIVEVLGIPDSMIDETVAREQAELQEREELYRGEGARGAEARGRCVILIDDGLATGASMRAAVMALRQRQPARIVVAVPVAAEEVCRAFRREVDEMVCLMTPEFFHAVGQWYEDFSQTSDAEVRELLARATASAAAGRKMPPGGAAFPSP